MRYVCIKCSRSLFGEPCLTRPLRRRLHRQPPSSTSAWISRHLHTTERKNTDNETQIKNKIVKPLLTRSWRTLLKKKSLGQDSSVLVLRDSEAKKGRRQTSAEEVPDTSFKGTAVNNTTNLLSSMKEQNSPPSDEEVFLNISNLRPKAEQDLAVPYEKQTLSIESFKKCVLKLSESFTRKQLWNYLYDNRKIEEVPSSTISQHLNRHRYIQCGKWIPSISKKQRKEDSLNASSGARAASRIIQWAWGFEIQDNASGRGSVNIKIDKALLSLLLVGGSRSALEDLSRRRAIGINVKRNSHMIQVEADRTECFRFADELDNLLHQHYAHEMDNIPQVFWLAKRTVRVIAERCHCAVDIVDSKVISPLTTYYRRKSIDDRKIIIRGWAQPSVQSCLRLLLSAKLPSVEICHVHGDLEQSGFVSPYPTCLDAPPHGLRDQNLGRYYHPQTLTKKSETTPFTARAATSLDEQLLRSIQTLVLHKPPDNFRLEFDSMLRAEFGHVLCPIPNGRILHPSTAKSLIKTHKHFIPTTARIPHSLLTSFFEPQRNAQRLLRIRLTPSPWNHSKTKLRDNTPDLEMSVSLDDHNSSSKLHTLVTEVILRREKLNVMIPHSPCDVRFVRQETINLVDLEKQPAVIKFIRDTENSAVEFGKLVPPPFVSIRLPTSILDEFVKGETNPRDEGELEFEYFVAGLDTEESVNFVHEGYNLNFTRTEGGEENGNREGMTLSTPMKWHPRHRAEEERFAKATSSALQKLNSREGAWGVSRNGSISKYL